MNKSYDSSILDPSNVSPIYIWDKTNPIQLTLPYIPKHGYISIEAGMDDPSKDDIYSVGLHIDLLHDSNGKIVYIYSGDTRTHDISVTLPKQIMSPISPSIPTPPLVSNITLPTGINPWPESIVITYIQGSVKNAFVQNSMADIYADRIQDNLYFSNGVNENIPVDPTKNIIRINTSVIPSGEHISVYIYGNIMNSLTFYNDNNYINTIIHNYIDISLNIEYISYSNQLVKSSSYNTVIQDNLAMNVDTVPLVKSPYIIDSKEKLQIFKSTNEQNTYIFPENLLVTLAIDLSMNTNISIKNYSIIDININGTISFNNININNFGTIINYSTINIVNTSTINNYNTIRNIGFINNYGTINNSGTIDNSAIINNSGTITNNGGTNAINDATINNTGTIRNNTGGTINNGLGTIKNYNVINNESVINIYYGTITNNGGTVYNSDTINTFKCISDGNPKTTYNGSFVGAITGNLVIDTPYCPLPSMY